MRHLQYIVIFLLIVSCKNEKIKFPFSEEQMVQNNMYGELLEYALYDTTRIDFVDSILCDTIRKNGDLIFSKVETEIDDISHYFFYLHEYEPIINDYIGMIYVDINKFDSIYMYCFDDDFKYSTDDFIKVIQEIAEHNKSTIEETIKHRKINNKYIPNFYFVVMFDSSCCESGFVRKVVWINQQIKSLMNACSESIFKNEKVKIKPYIEISSCYTEIYNSRFDYYPLPIMEENILIEEDEKIHVD